MVTGFLGSFILFNNAIATDEITSKGSIGKNKENTGSGNERRTFDVPSMLSFSSSSCQKARVLM